MKANEITDQQSQLIIEELDRLLWSLLDDLRASNLGSRPWPEAIGLLALRFMTADPNGPDKWAEVIQRPHSDDVAPVMRQLAELVEASHLEVHEVFSKALLSGLDRIPNSILLPWVYRLAHLSRINLSEPLFGSWLSAKVTTLAMERPDSGQFTTPPSLARLMVKLAGIPKGASVFDPCCGIGTVLAAAVEASAEQGEQVSVFGEELSPVSWALCRLRLFFLGQDPSSVVLGDSLRRPAFVENDRLHKFDRVFCDTPLGMTLQDGSWLAHDPYGRFVFSGLSRGSGDIAFVQHAIASMKPEGKAVLLLSHGFLFRAGADARVREGLMKTGLIECVIGLPAKLLPGTAIESAVVVLGKNDSGRIRFVDASGLQTPVRGKAELSAEAIEQIFHMAQGPDGSHVKTLTSVDIEANDFSLLPRRYITADTEPAESVDLVTMRAQIKALDNVARHTASEMDSILERLAIA